jgi:hypothetical protein
MRGINFLAGLGTILIFIGIFCFKALFPKQVFREGNLVPRQSPNRILLIIAGLVAILLGCLLIIKSLKIFPALN